MPDAAGFVYSAVIEQAPEIPGANKRGSGSFAPGIDPLLPAAGNAQMACIDAKREWTFEPPFYPRTRWAVPADPLLIEGNANYFARPDTYPTGPADLQRVHAIQDLVTVEQERPGRFYIPDWDPASHQKVADALAAFGVTLSDRSRAAGRPDEVDPIHHLIVSATGRREEGGDAGAL